MFIKKVALFILVFLVACSILFIFNTDNKDNKLYDKYQLQEYKIDTNETIVIEVDDLSNGNVISDRIKIIEVDELTDSVIVYRNRFYDLKKDKFSIDYDSNTIIINDYLSNTITYKSTGFITYAQFDYNYFNSIPHNVYEIHVPSGLGHTIKGS